jgi:predicted XRE-type DNA-binding protein
LRQGRRTRQMSEHDNTEDVVIESSCGNVFADIGIELSESDMLKVSIAHAISDILQDGEYTQAQAAEIMGIDQPKVSKLMRGRLKEFKADRLMEYLMLLGYDLEVKYRKSKSKRGKVKLVA